MRKTLAAVLGRRLTPFSFSACSQWEAADWRHARPSQAVSTARHRAAGRQPRHRTGRLAAPRPSLTFSALNSSSPTPRTTRRSMNDQVNTMIVGGIKGLQSPSVDLTANTSVVQAATDANIPLITSNRTA